MIKYLAGKCLTNNHVCRFCTKKKTCYNEFYKDIELTTDETTELDTVIDDTTIITQIIFEVEKRRPL